MISPSPSPSFGHFAKTAQNVSKARCSLVWEIIDVLRRPREAWRVHAKHILMGSDGYAIGGKSPYYYKSLHRMQAFPFSDKSTHHEIRDFYAHMALTYERHFARCFCRYSGNIVQTQMSTIAGLFILRFSRLFISSMTKVQPSPLSHWYTSVYPVFPTLMSASLGRKTS